MNMFGILLEKLDGKKIRETINRLLNEFEDNYTFMMKHYYKFPPERYSTSIDINFNDQKEIKPGNHFPDYMNKVVLKSMKYAIRQLKPKMNTTELIVYKPLLIKTKINEGIDKFDFDEFPKQINLLLQDLSKKQCKMYKKCCI